MKFLCKVIDYHRSDSKDVIIAEPIKIFGISGWCYMHPSGTVGLMGDSEFHRTYVFLSSREVIEYWKNNRYRRSVGLFTYAENTPKIDPLLLRHIAEYECSNGSGFYQIPEESWNELASVISERIGSNE